MMFINLKLQTFLLANLQGLQRNDLQIGTDARRCNEDSFFFSHGYGDSTWAFAVVLICETLAVVILIVTLGLAPLAMKCMKSRAAISSVFIPCRGICDGSVSGKASHLHGSFAHIA